MYKGTRQENYQLVKKQLQALLHGEKNQIANLSNTSSLLNQFLDRINWVGFYLMDENNELVLGPFKGCLHVFASRSTKVCVEQLLRIWKPSGLRTFINFLAISPAMLHPILKSSSLLLKMVSYWVYWILTHQRKIALMRWTKSSWRKLQLYLWNICNQKNSPWRVFLFSK